MILQAKIIGRREGEKDLPSCVVLNSFEWSTSSLPQEGRIASQQRNAPETSFGCLCFEKML